LNHSNQKQEAGKGSFSRGLNADPLIFFSVLGLVLLILLAAIINRQQTALFLFGLQDSIVEYFSWLFSLTVTGLLVFSVWLACSRYGNIKLGPDDSEPEFNNIAWVSMLFSAGMGIGLVFFGVAEPVLHYIAPLQAAPETIAAAREAMRLSIFHWGLHAWAIYAVLGLALAYYHFRHNQPLAIRSTLEPLLGKHTHQWPGKLIDVLAVLGTLFGLATSLGLGASQINAGLGELFGIAISTNTQIIIIAVITFCATVSLVLGLKKGIRRLSELNMMLALLLMGFVLFAGPTSALLRGLPDHLGNYLQGLPGLSLSTHPFRNLEWQKSYTIFYWAWWLSWSPFVGMFIARISRGRTIRQFVLGVLIIPTLLSLLWFGIFGGAALRLELFGGGGLTEAVQENSATAIYALLANFPFATLANWLAIILVAIFFITSSDSGSFVVDMLTSGGDPNPPVLQRVFWACTEGTLAIILLMLGGLGALQAGAVSMGLPFCLVILAVAWSLWRKLVVEENSAEAEKKG
jgi:choline/glycine/proline betaine transport protein